MTQGNTRDDWEICQKAALEAPKTDTEARNWLRGLIQREPKFRAPGNLNEELLLHAARVGNLSLAKALVSEGESAAQSHKRQTMQISVCEKAFLKALESDQLACAAFLVSWCELGGWAQRHQEPEGKEDLYAVLAQCVVRARINLNSYSENRKALAPLIEKILESARPVPDQWRMVAAMGIWLDHPVFLDQALANGVDLWDNFLLTEDPREDPIPLFCVAGKLGAVNALEKLLSMDADADLRKRHCVTALMWAAYPQPMKRPQDALACVKRLLPLAGECATDASENTALMWSVVGAERWNAGLTRYLVARCNPNAQNEKGETALMWAMQNHCGAEDSAAEVIGILAAVSDCSIKNSAGKTVLDLALTNPLRIHWERVNAVFKEMRPEAAEIALRQVMERILPAAIPKIEALAVEREWETAKKSVPTIAEPLIGEVKREPMEKSGDVSELRIGRLRL